MRYVKAYLGTVAAFLAVDSVWLAYIARDFYRENIGHLMLDKPNFGAAAVFYLLYIAGIVFLAVRPALATRRWQTAAAHGAVFGLVAYATYDLTNLATLRGWPVKMVVIDMAWGLFLTAAAATGGFFAARGAGSRSEPA